MKQEKEKKQIYLDYSATTPTDPRVIEAMTDFMKNYPGNPSSIHSFGRDARNKIEDARETIRDFIGADEASEIIFTSGGTESDSMAILGVLEKSKIAKPHVITTSIEHKAVLSIVQKLEKEGFIEASYLKVDRDGKISIEDLQKEIKHNTVLVSVMYANNEIGTVQPIREIGKYIEKINKSREKAAFPRVYFHTDAVQAFSYLKINVKYLHVDLMSVSAHKFCGPKGVGFIYIKEGVYLENVFIGGGQEFGKRAGTENTQSIIGMAEAVKILKKEQEKDTKKVKELRDKLIQGALKIEGVKLTGHPKDRIPSLASFVFANIEGESILISLDLLGIAVSTGSACTSGTLTPSHVLTACGYTPVESQGNIRFSLGKYTTKEEINKVLEVLPGIVGRLREMSPLE